MQARAKAFHLQHPRPRARPAKRLRRLAENPKQKGHRDFSQRPTANLTILPPLFLPPPPHRLAQICQASRYFSYFDRCPRLGILTFAPRHSVLKGCDFQSSRKVPTPHHNRPQHRGRAGALAPRKRLALPPASAPGVALRRAARLPSLPRSNSRNILRTQAARVGVLTFCLSKRGYGARAPGTVKIVSGWVAEATVTKGKGYQHFC